MGAANRKGRQNGPRVNRITFGAKWERQKGNKPHEDVPRARRPRDRCSEDYFCHVRTHSLTNKQTI